MADEVEYLIEPLDKQKHDRAAFVCREQALTDYLRQQASKDSEYDIARTHVLVNPQNPSQIVGYHTLSTTSIEVEAARVSILQRRAPRYNDYPALMLGRLAVDTHFSGQGLGTILMLDVYSKAVEFTKVIAAVALIADAKNDNLIDRFYSEFRFKRLEGYAHRIYISMSGVRSYLANLEQSLDTAE